MTAANLQAIAKRVVAAFGIAFLTAVLSANADWNVSVLEKAAVAGVVAAATLLQSVLTAWYSGQPQITGALARRKAPKNA